MTKLTLSIDEDLLTRAKRKLKTKQTSLSELVSNYFKALIALEKTKAEKTPIVDSLAGIAKMSKFISLKKIITEYLFEKYL